MRIGACKTTKTVQIQHQHSFVEKHYYQRSTYVETTHSVHCAATNTKMKIDKLLVTL